MLGHRQARAFREIVGSVENEAPSRLHRATELDAHVGDLVRDAVDVAVAQDVELRDEIAETDHRRHLVNNDTHGAALGMDAHVDQGPVEPRVAHAGHGDQNLTVEVGS